MNEPDYYTKNGLSPIGAFKRGLLSDEQYKGFLMGNVIKYVVRAGNKDDAIRDLEKAKHYLDFYIEWHRNHKGHDVPIKINVDNDIDMDKFREELEKAIKEANEHPELTFFEPEIEHTFLEVPTDDPHIAKVKLSEAMYDENGELKPEAREKVKQYLLERRNHE